MITVTKCELKLLYGSYRFAHIVSCNQDWSYFISIFCMQELQTTYCGSFMEMYCLERLIFNNLLSGFVTVVIRQQLNKAKGLKNLCETYFMY